MMPFKMPDRTSCFRMAAHASAVASLTSKEIFVRRVVCVGAVIGWQPGIVLPATHAVPGGVFAAQP